MVLKQKQRRSKMKNETYTVKGNKTAADVIANNDQVIETGYTKEEAILVAVEVQKTGEFVAAWIEGEAGKPAPLAAATMISLEKHPKMEAAIARARSFRPRVTVISASARIYSVTGSKGDHYVVRVVVVGAKKLANCNCAAGQVGQLCYHVASAAQVNIMTQSMRRQRPAALPVLPARSADERAELVADIKATWSRRFPGESLADNLMARFRVNALSMLNVDFLRRVLAAIA